MANWVSDLDDILYTTIKYKLEKKYKDDYPDISIVNSAKKLYGAKFPTVYVQTLGNESRNATFEGGVNGITYDIQISVSALEETTARTIMDDIVEIMCEKYFSVTVNSLPNDTDDAFGRVSRFSRSVGESDPF